MRCILGMLIWVWSLRDESVGRHLAGYVDSDYAGEDLDNLCSTLKLEVDLQWVWGQYR